MKNSTRCEVSLVRDSNHASLIQQCAEGFMVQRHTSGKHGGGTATSSTGCEYQCSASRSASNLEFASAAHQPWEQRPNVPRARPPHERGNFVLFHAGGSHLCVRNPRAKEHHSRYCLTSLVPCPRAAHHGSSYSYIEVPNIGVTS